METTIQNRRQAKRETRIERLVSSRVNAQVNYVRSLSSLLKTGDIEGCAKLVNSFSLKVFIQEIIGRDLTNEESKQVCRSVPEHADVCTEVFEACLKARTVQQTIATVRRIARECQGLGHVPNNEKVAKVRLSLLSGLEYESEKLYQLVADIYAEREESEESDEEE